MHFNVRGGAAAHNICHRPGPSTPVLSKVDCKNCKRSMYADVRLSSRINSLKLWLAELCADTPTPGADQHSDVYDERDDENSERDAGITELREALVEALAVHEQSLVKTLEATRLDLQHARAAVRRRCNNCGDRLLNYDIAETLCNACLDSTQTKLMEVPCK